MNSSLKQNVFYIRKLEIYFEYQQYLQKYNL